MAIIHFYEKPGCFNNSRQKQLLIGAGHLLIVHDLLKYPWKHNRQLLRAFFGDLPVADWFNRAAPAIKNGDVDPDSINEIDAIEKMVADPILIRRPLIEVAGRRRVGFDVERIDAWLGLQADVARGDLETCPKPRQQVCRS